MTNQKMLEQVKNGRGFIAALDQSGGSTPKALKQYGVSESEYSGEAQMFDMIHAMRARIIKSPAFTGDKVMGAILFERTMDGAIDGIPTAEYLWTKRGVVPFLKVDKGETRATGAAFIYTFKIKTADDTSGKLICTVDRSTDSVSSITPAAS